MISHFSGILLLILWNNITMLRIITIFIISILIKQKVKWKKVCYLFLNNDFYYCICYYHLRWYFKEFHAFVLLLKGIDDSVSFLYLTVDIKVAFLILMGRQNTKLKQWLGKVKQWPQPRDLNPSVEQPVWKLFNNWICTGF